MYENVIIILTILSVFVTILYLLFSKVKLPSNRHGEDSPFLGSDSSNSYFKATDVFQKLDTDDKTPEFRGDHRI